MKTRSRDRRCKERRKANSETAIRLRAPRVSYLLMSRLWGEVADFLASREEIVPERTATCHHCGSPNVGTTVLTAYLRYQQCRTCHRSQPETLALSDVSLRADLEVLRDLFPYNETPSQSP